MKINLNNKKIKIKLAIIIIIISVFISIMAIYKYYINDWICYQENEYTYNRIEKILKQNT